MKKENQNSVQGEIIEGIKKGEDVIYKNRKWKFVEYRDHNFSCIIKSGKKEILVFGSQLRRPLTKYQKKFFLAFLNQFKDMDKFESYDGFKNHIQEFVGKYKPHHSLDLSAKRFVEYQVALLFKKQRKAFAKIINAE